MRFKLEQLPASEAFPRQNTPLVGERPNHPLEVTKGSLGSIPNTIYILTIRG
jgi:hypothetical protein